jgi:hypothetical protein
MPQNAPTIQSTVADPNFQKLGTDDKITVLSHIDSNFKGLKPDIQMEVLSHLMQSTGEHATVGPATDVSKPSFAQPRDLQQSTLQAHGSDLRETAREALPYAGAAVGSLLAGPEVGLGMRAGAAFLGGGAGSVASHAIPGGNQPPLLSKAGVIDVAEDAAKQAALELGGALAGSGITKALTSKVPIEQAAAKLADSISPNLTPSEFGEKLRQTLTTTRQTLGQQKGQALDDIVSKFMPSQPNFFKTQLALNDSIATLEAQKKLTPSLFQAGESKAKTLAVLNDIKSSIASGNFAQPGTSVFRGMDDLRSNLFQMGKGMDAPMPKSMVNQLTHAVHDDIGVTLHQFGSAGDAAFQKFESTSSAFRETADILDTSTFKRIMKANVNQPEKVLNILMQAPETNVENLQTMLKNAPNGAEVVQSMKHLALERAASYPQGLDSIPGPARQVVFGSDLPKIEKFFDAVKDSGNTGMLSRMTSNVSGLLGGHAGAMMTNWVVKSGSQAGTISSTQLAVLLGNASTRQLLMRAAETPASSMASALVFRALGTYIEAPSAQPAQQQAPQAQGGASIGDQLKSKGVQLPMAQPNTPGLPFHPGAGL